MEEFAAINKFFKKPLKNKTCFPLNVGDDCALIAVPAGHELVTSIDTLVENTHFLPGTNPSDIGYKSLAVSLSDLAAMGAEPAAVLLALTLPEADEQWLTEFTRGFFRLADDYQTELIGGNMTRGSLSISTVVYGWIPQGQAILREGAKPGDDIYVTGTLGNAGLALQYLLDSKALSADLHQHFFQPTPRLVEGIALRGTASAAIDISDGLAADLGKLLEASRVGARIHTRNLPISPEVRSQCTDPQAMHLALTAGEDYELCFTAQQKLRDSISALFTELDCAVTRIGQIEAAEGLRILNEAGKLINIMIPGYQHF